MKTLALHAKSITIDEAYSIIGAYNIDSYGSAYNLEVGIGLHGEAPARELNQIFLEALEDSHEMRLGDWLSRNPFQRLIQWTAY